MEALIPGRQSPPPTDLTKMGEAEMIDLEEIVRDHFKEYLDRKQRKRADLKNPIINWDRMSVKFGETNYKVPDAAPKPPKVPDTHILFSATFSNNTPKPQTYALRTERRTKSTCTISFSKTYAYGVNLNIRLSPPTPVIQANAGFKSDFSQTKGQNQTFERELTWSVDNNITVPSGFKTKAELVITEDNYNRDFEVPCYFEGMVSATFETKKKEHVSTGREHVDVLFGDKKGFTKEDGRLMFMVKGCCSCRFGIEQSVRLTEKQMTEEEKTAQAATMDNEGAAA